MKNRGFTLVELSIVLVIIGLLIGGILVGQSLIESAKINAQIQQFQQFDAATMGFKSKYKYLPGDAPAFGGDGDGLIEMTAASGWNNHLEAFGCEISFFWNNISPTDFTNGQCNSPGKRPTVSGSTKNVPKAKVGPSNSFIIASALPGVVPDVANALKPQNFYAILHPTQAQTVLLSWYHFFPTTSANSATSPAVLLSLDQKMDDGIGNTGTVLSGIIKDDGQGIGGIFPTPLSTCSDSSTGKYDLTQSGNECTPLVRIGASAGNPL